jgi:hypothetical protein
MDALLWLKDLVQKILPEWEVSTPDANEAGNIMYQVIKSCDRSDLVIANTNGNNPNVLYEIAILDALGRACIPVKIDEQAGDTETVEPISFDRAAYRVFTIYRHSSHRHGETDNILRSVITATLHIEESGDLYDNPTTDFFGVTLSSLSPAHGLARGYYINFVRPAALALPDKRIGKSAFDPARFIERRLEILIPERLEDVSRSSIEELIERKTVKQISFHSKDRTISVFEWAKQEGPVFRWVDFPTTLSTLKGNVLGRLGRSANKDPEGIEFREIEADEIGQFERALKGRINAEESADAGKIRKNVCLRKWRKGDAT